MSPMLTRRSLLCGSALLGLGVASASLAGCAPAASGAMAGEELPTAGSQQPSYSKLMAVNEEDVSETIDVDVVVVGSGTGGTFAAVRAAEQGARVLWLEKRSELGGTSVLTEGIAAVDSSLMKEAKADPRKGELFQLFMDSQDWGAIPEVVDAYLDNNGAAIDWALGHGAECIYSPVSPDTYWGGVCFDAQGNFLHIGEGILEPLWSFGDTLENLEVRTETPAVNLIIEDGKTAGVYAQASDGTLIRANAKAVVLASGGFCSNDEMVERYLNIAPGAVKFYGMEGRDGDGVNMALAAGSPMHGATAAMYTFGAVDGASSFHDIVNATFGWGSLLSVNQDGRRFFNEGINLGSDTARRNIALRTQRASYTIADDAYVQEYIALGEIDFVTGKTVGDLKENIDAYESIVRADSLADLAASIGVDPATLEASVEEYNAIASGTTDDRFGLTAEQVVPVLKAPFYAARMVPSSYATEGGATTNAAMQVLGAEGQVIEGLYAVGNDNGSIINTYYPMHVLGGTAQGFAATGGFVAANDIAERYL